MNSWHGIEVPEFCELNDNFVGAGIPKVDLVSLDVGRWTLNRSGWNRKGIEFRAEKEFGTANSIDSL